MLFPVSSVFFVGGVVVKLLNFMCCSFLACHNHTNENSGGDAPNDRQKNCNFLNNFSIFFKGGYDSFIRPTT
jgi:hypothetical protein